MNYNEIIKEAQDIMQNLFEVGYYGANDVEEENNKIKKQKKDKNGEIVDVVSVEDELFPYEGSAKQQYNQKIISKINDMIEGKATLEDLIQLVRRKKVSECYEGAAKLIEALINEKVTVAKWVEAAKRAKDGRAEKASKELMKNIFGGANNDKESHNAVHRSAHADAVSKLAPSDDNAQDVREIHRAAIEPLRKKVDRAIKAGKSERKDVERLEKAQEIAGVRPDSSKYVS